MLRSPFQRVCAQGHPFEYLLPRHPRSWTTYPFPFEKKGLLQETRNALQNVDREDVEQILRQLEDFVRKLWR